jgi:putative oxidoreductase
MGDDNRGVEVSAAVDGWLERYSVPLLRISMGLVIFGFGVLKYFPGVSPAQSIVLKVNHRLTFGLIPDNVTLVLFATIESLIGLSLITGWGLRVIIYPLAMWAVAILSPIVLFPGRLFSGPDHAPTLEGQYVLKDVILLTACLVIATHVRRGTK